MTFIWHKIILLTLALSNSSYLDHSVLAWTENFLRHGFKYTTATKRNVQDDPYVDPDCVV